MKIEHNNWSPAIDIFNRINDFQKDLKDIKEKVAGIPDFNDNFKQGRLTASEIEDTKAAVLLLSAKVDATARILDEMEKAYHDYQEMYFENIEER